MHLRIWTHWEGRSWSGEIPGPPEPDALPEHGDALDYVFRYFNDVDEGDRARMLAVGYDLPSLSVDDVVTLGDGTSWRCAPLGWEAVSSSEPPTPITKQPHARPGSGLTFSSTRADPRDYLPPLPGGKS